MRGRVTAVLHIFCQIRRNYTSYNEPTNERIKMNYDLINLRIKEIAELDAETENGGFLVALITGTARHILVDKMINEIMLMHESEKVRAA